MALANSHEIIEIEGDLVRLVTKTVSYEVALKDIFPQLQSFKPVTLPTIARSQVFAHWDESNPAAKSLYILAEIPPGIKNIRKNDRRYRLAMPWTYFWFVASTAYATSSDRWALESYYAYHAKDRYVGLDSTFITARTPNVYNTGKICWGTTGANPSLSLADRIDSLVHDWYLSTFNSDLDGEVSLPYNERNYRRWVDETRTNPLCWQNWPEWTNESVSKNSVRNLLSFHGANATVDTITLPNLIPPIGNNLTFGRWEEWFNNIQPVQRGRALRALLNRREDNFEDVPEEEEEDTSDDGGVEIDTDMEESING